MANYFTTLVTRFEKTKRYDALSGGLFLLTAVIAIGIPGILAGVFGDIVGPYRRNASVVILVVTALVVTGGALFAGGLALDGHLRKASLRGPMLAFCYAFDCLRELTAYVTNGFPEHADLANKALEGFLKHSEVNFKLSVEEMRPGGGLEGPVTVTVQKDVNIGEILGSLTDSISWLELAPQSAAIAKAIRMIPERLQRRLAIRVDVDAVLDCVRDLVLYQYTVIRTTTGSQSADTDTTARTDVKYEFLASFARRILELEELPPRSASEVGMIDLLRRRITALTGAILMSPNLVVSFVSWFVLLGTLFDGVAVTVAGYFALKLDTGLVVGMLAAPFAGAIAMSTAIFTKRR